MMAGATPKPSPSPATSAARSLPEGLNWITVGFAAFTEEEFKRSKEAVGELGETAKYVQMFAPSTMGAVWESRKASVRRLGGTLTSSVPARKGALKLDFICSEAIIVSLFFL